MKKMTGKIKMEYLKPGIYRTGKVFIGKDGAAVVMQETKMMTMKEIEKVYGKKI